MFRGLISLSRPSSLLLVLVLTAVVMVFRWNRLPISSQEYYRSRQTDAQDCSHVCATILKNSSKGGDIIKPLTQLDVPHKHTQSARCLHDPINFEPPQPNSLTGPRATPLKPRAKRYLIRSRLSFHSNFHAERLVQTLATPMHIASLTDPFFTSLVAIPVGEKSKDAVSSIIKAFGFQNFTFMLFHYDSTNWSDMPWYDNVIAIRYPKQMKWWYIKRFVSPQVAESYEFIFAVDEDASLEFIDVSKFVEILRAHNISIAQPAMHSKSSFVSHQITRQVVHTDPSIVGRWTDFAECGPLIAFSSDAYGACIWDFIQEDLTSGWGLDLHWHDYCKQRTGKEATAVIDKYPQVHLSFGTASHRDPDPKRPKYDPGAENAMYSQRFHTVKSASMKVLGNIRML